jgi:L-malate glycosyltransferase
MRLNVLFLCSYYPNRVRNGGTFIERHARAVALSADVSVLAMEADSSMNAPYELVYSTEYDGRLQVVRAYYNLTAINIPVLRTTIHFFRFWLAAYRGYQLLCKKTRKPQIVHLNVVRPLGVFALFLKYFKGLPFVLTEHSTAYLAENKNAMTYFETRLTKKVLTAASCIMPVSNLLQNAIQQQFHIESAKFQVVSNVVSSDIFYFKPSMPSVGKFKFLHISNMRAFKNVEGILNTLHRLKQIRNDFELHIIGDGEDRPSLQVLTQQLGFSDEMIFFHLQQTEVEIVNYMHWVDCFILFSHFETASMVVLESLCCGLPVIGTRVGIVHEAVQDGKNGILIPVGDEEALLSACLTMMQNKQDFINPSYYVDYAHSLSPQYIGQQYLNIYQKILTK